MDPNQEINTDDQDQTSDHDEFDAAFDALDNPGGEPSGDNDPVGDLEGKESGTGEAEDNTEPMDDKSVSHVDATDAAGHDDPPADDKQPSQNDDIWKDAPEAARSAYSQLERDKQLEIASLKGHQSAQDRRIAQLQAQLDEARKAGGNQGDGGSGDGGDAGGDETAGASPFDSPEIKALQEEYGEVAGPLVNLIRQQQDQIEQLRQPVAALSDDQFKSRIAVQEKFLTENQPDWRDVAQDPRFTGWLDQAPPMYREAFKRNHDFIVDGREAAEVIGKFKTEMGITTPNPKTTDSEPGKPDPRRQQQLEASKDVAGGGGTPAARGIPKNDFDSSFDAFFGSSKT